MGEELMMIYLINEDPELGVLVGTCMLVTLAILSVCMATHFLVDLFKNRKKS